MNQRWATIAFILGLVILAAYSYLGGKEYEIRLTAEQLFERLNSRMPIRREYLLIFEVTLDRPRVSLSEGSNRVVAGLDVTLNIGLQSEKVPFGGTIDVSGGLRYDAPRGQFFLTDPVIEKFSVQGIPARYSEKVNQVVTRALGEYYADHPVYTLNPFDLKQGAARLVLKRVEVDANELVVTLGI